MSDAQLWEEVFLDRVKNGMPVDQAAQVACRAVLLRDAAHANEWRSTEPSTSRIEASK